MTTKPYQLYYWPIPGRAEAARVALSLANLDWEDVEIDGAMFSKMKKEGSLRNMTARLEIQKPSVGHEAADEQPPRPYNPADYHLMPVIDLHLNQHRNMATDRVTWMVIGDRILSTESAED